MRAVSFKPISTLLRFDIGEPYHFRPFVDFAGNELAGYIDARPHIPQLGQIFLQRTAGPYIWVKSVEAGQGRSPVYVRCSPKADMPFTPAATSWRTRSWLPRASPHIRVSGRGSDTQTAAWSDRLR